jgi:glycosyltransferase involved in cell wall biosynthesis
MKKTGVSVVVCTYNGSANLPETIKHIARQNVPSDIPWEFVIINNASTDSTPEIAIAEWEKHNSPANITVRRRSELSMNFNPV